MRAQTLLGIVAALSLAACAPKARTAVVAHAPIEALPELRAAIAPEPYPGVVAVLREGSASLWCSDVARCGQRVTPASTFKIPNALIGLETGVIPDADFVIPWDGVERQFPAWNRDQTLRSAIADSAVPYFQELARRVGPERMQAWLDKLAYGNARMGAEVDQFWLRGPLSVSPVEQIDFLQRLARGTLPVSARSLAIVREAIVLDQHDGRVLRGKTGWAAPGEPDEVGWFVGFVEEGEQRAYVAVLLFGANKRDVEHFRAARRRVAERSLAALGLW